MARTIQFLETIHPDFIFAEIGAHPYLKAQFKEVWMPMELGLYTFADVDPSPSVAKGPEAARRLKNLL